MTRKLCVFLLLLLLAGMLFSVGVVAENGDFEETPPDEFGEFLSAIPEEIAELLPPGLFSKNTGEIAEELQRLSSFSNLSALIGSLFSTLFGKILPVFCTVAGLLLLSALFSAIRTSLKSESVAKAFSFASTLALLGALLTQISAVVGSVVSYFDRLKTLF